MKTFVASALLLGMFQQILADDTPAPLAEKSPAPKYIPPPPKPALVKPPIPSTPGFLIQRLIQQAPYSRYVVPRSEHFKSAQPQPVFFTAPLSKRIEKAVEANPKRKMTPHLETFVLRVKNISAKQAALAVSNAFARKHKIKITSQGIVADSPVVIIPDHPTNSLIVTTAAEYVNEIKQLIASVDKAPKQFRIETTIKVIGADGKTIVARPQITTFENQLMNVRIENADGTSIELQLKVRELTQPQKTFPGVTKATAGNVSPHPMPAVPTSASYRLIDRKPSSSEVYKALSASFRPIHYLGHTLRMNEPKQETDREKEIEQALGKQISLHFEEARLIDVIKHIATSTGINILLDDRGLEEEGLTKDTKISIDVTEIRLKSALNLLLKPIGLAYKFEDEVLEITSKSKSQRPMTTVNYPVGNLLAVPSPDHAAISSETLIKLITSLIEPDSWSERGGQGVIHKFESTHSLVIRQTEKGHEKIKKLLNSLREAKQDDSE